MHITKAKDLIQTCLLKSNIESNDLVMVIRIFDEMATEIRRLQKIEDVAIELAKPNTYGKGLLHEVLANNPSPDRSK